MPRGKKKQIVSAETPIETSEKVKVPTKESVLKEAKKLGLFKKNQYNSTYEIVIPIGEYEKI